MTDVWEQLTIHRSKTEQTPIQSLFRKDPDRFAKFSACCGDLLLDFSKTSIDSSALDLLASLASQAGLSEKITAMFAGHPINSTEDRAVLHTALRAPADTSVVVDGHNAIPAIQKTLVRMGQFSEALRQGEIISAAGKRFTDVVHIGIGGSDLGPVMTTLALAPYHDGPKSHFVSNVDGAHIHDTLKDLDAASTLVIIASKTFTTIETMTNAQAAIEWLQATIGEAFPEHLAAVSSAPENTAKFGISPERVFGFEDWVGGRYSVWGPVGLPLMIAIGLENFRAFLSGGADMDRHFQETQIRKNLPVLMGLVGVWHNNICGYRTRAVLPYDQRLSRLPAYLQQLDMESNGKRVDLNGKTLVRHSGPVIWGEPGTNGQHAFFQLLHQGTQIIPAEFLIAAEGHEPSLAHQHDLLKANCLAQSEALMRGRDADQARELANKRGYQGEQVEKMAAHLTFPGNRPSITLAYPKLTPFVLGQLIALFEHRVFTEGAIWGINSFDQWGVELGKELATGLLPMVQGASSEGKDPSTRGLLAALSKSGSTAA